MKERGDENEREERVQLEENWGELEEHWGEDIVEDGKGMCKEEIEKNIK